MRKQLSVLIAGAGLLMAAMPALAHHAFSAEFDANKPIKLKGTVTKMEWINPHAWIHIAVKDDAGKSTEWMVECGSPNTLLRKGFTKASVTAGMEILTLNLKDAAERVLEGLRTRPVEPEHQVRPGPQA